ncbi:right-handed parallel beta-helix repeat-containing protein, partial [Candidatus Bipolaricaulota bacterium]|nr:right-handed parallel beta-helix repeat-containing protein [Candidatus Bipolaricaulota bacterium]
MNKSSFPRLALIVLVLTVLFGLTVSGATLVVDGSDPDCDDSTGTPYCSIQAAVDYASSGDTIEIYNSFDNSYVYKENVEVEKLLDLVGFLGGLGSIEEAYPNIDGGWIDGAGNFTDAGDALWLKGTESEPITQAEVYTLILKNGGLNDPGLGDGLAGALGLSFVEDSVVVVDASESEVGIDLFRSHDNLIGGSFVHDNYFLGIDLYGSNRNEIRDSEIYDNQWMGIWIGHNPGDGFTAEDNLVKSNIIENSDWTGVVLHYADSNEVIDNDILDNYHDGVFLRNSHYNLIEDNLIEGNKSGIALHASEENEILDNIIRSNDDWGIFLNDSDDNYIHFNEIYDN